MELNEMFSTSRNLRDSKQNDKQAVPVLPLSVYQAAITKYHRPSGLNNRN